MTEKMKLFVWEDVLIDYTSGIAFAMAHDVNEARAKLLSDADDWMRENLAADISKEPTHVYDDVSSGYVWGGG